MKISLDWLKKYIDITDDVRFISETLTDIGLEVSNIETFSMFNTNLIIGKVLTCKQHPNAERLKITTVDIGKETPLNIVCGAPNVKQDQMVIVAPVDTSLTLYNGEELKLKKVKIRGELSEGMICAEDEIGISDNHNTIIELNTDLKPGTSVLEYYKTRETSVFDIDLTPNRTDAFSHIGVARDLAAKLDLKLKYPEIPNINKPKNPLKIEIKVEDSNLCPRYAGLIIKNIEIKESPICIKNRLKSIGLNPINNIVDITNYVLHETGQPLHAFDYDLIQDKQIIVKPLGQKTSFITLDDKEKNLDGEELMICDSQKPLCIAGVMGGKNSLVTENTTTIFLESAYFNSTSITKTAKKLGINSDSSYRFERGTDPNKVVDALKRAAQLILKTTNAEIASEILDIYPTKIENIEVNLNFDNVNKLIGEEIAKEKIKKILTNLEFIIIKESEKDLLVSIPSYRVDVTREADVIEEILRIYGYNNITFDETLSSSFLAEKNNVMKAWAKKEFISNLLTSKGYNEIITNSLTDAKYNDLSKNTEYINILNPLSEITNSLRTTLLFSGLEVISNNINRGNKNLKLFEFGKNYYIENKSYIEKTQLGIFVTLGNGNISWIKTKNESIFQVLNEAIHAIFEILGIEITKKHIDSEIFSTAISFVNNNKILANFGYINLNILKHFKINQNVIYAEIDWEQISKLPNPIIEYKQISKFPEVSRDLSLILPKSKTYDEIQSIINNFGEKKLIDYKLIDIYEGSKIEQTKKTLTLNFTLQDQKNTLKDKEIDKIMNKLIELFESKLEAEIKRF